MSRWWILAASLAVLSQPAAAQPAADARQDVLATIETMFRAMRTKDTTLLRSVFEPVELLRLNGRWLIVSIADTYQAAGCPARPKP